MPEDKTMPERYRVIEAYQPEFPDPWTVHCFRRELRPQRRCPSDSLKVMLRSNIFSNKAAYLGILMSVMMLVPPTVGMIGLLPSVIPLVAAATWLILIARRLFQPR